MVALTKDEAKQAVDTVNRSLSAGYRPPGTMGTGPGAVAVAALDILRIPIGTLQTRLRTAKTVYGLEPDWTLWTRPTLHEAAVEEPPEAPSLEPAFLLGATTYMSRADDTYMFGVVSDNHLGSKYERLDVLNELYDIFLESGVDRVYNCGNWIEGESHFNKHELLVHGMDAQLQYLAKNYPKRDGIVTYAVSGDDHEGWYAQREGVNVGKYAERVMRGAGRDDWVDLGYMEAHVSLFNSNSRQSATMAVVHPGGGSAYATSYAPQKWIEALEGGEKPAVVLFGHWHKMLAGNCRNVWYLECGTTKDQDSFMRKKRLEAHVGGTIVTLGQDQASGAIVRFLPDMRRYFVRGFYDGRWSHSQQVTLPERAA